MEPEKLTSIKELSQSLFRFEQEQMLEHGSTMPVQYIIKDHGIVAIPAPFSNYEEKMRMSQFTTLLAGLLQADAIIFLSEAWFAVQEAVSKVPENATPEEINRLAHQEAERRKVPPSEDPNRQEKLMMMVFFGNGETMLGHSDIVRTGPNDRAYAEDLEWMSEEPSTMQTTRLFKAWKGDVTQALIERIIGSLPDHLRQTLGALRSSLESGKPMEEQINESMGHFGFDVRKIRVH